MNIDFHYGETLKTAEEAGIPHLAAVVLAHACQLTDDNQSDIHVSAPDKSVFWSRPTQTLSVFASDASRHSIYPPFHFLPGDAGGESPRRDGKTHPLCVTPGSSLCNAVMDAAIASGDLLRLGIAAHACCDSWAHQNFVGAWDGFNGTGNAWRPNIGHADVYGMPDARGVVWEDPRLCNPRCDNNVRFAEARAWLLSKLRGAVSFDFGELPETGETYSPTEWFDVAVKTEIYRRECGKSSWQETVYTFRSPDWKTCAWVRFQEAARAHSEFVWSVLAGRGVA